VSVQPFCLCHLVSDVAQHGLETEHLTFPTLLARFRQQTMRISSINANRGS